MEQKTLKLQKALSVIPIFSTIFITIFTVINIKRHKDTLKNWSLFFIILFGSVLAGFFLNTVIMSGENPFLNFVLSWLISIITNLLLVELQAKSIKGGELQEIPEVKTEEEKSDKKRLFIILAIVLVPILIFFGVYIAVLLNKGISNHNENTIADTNGEQNISLNTITKEDILNDKYLPTKMWFGDSQEGGQSDISDEKLKKTDYDKVSFSAKTFSGVDVLQATKVDSDKLVLDISSEVKSGNFAVMVVIDGEYYCDVDVNTTTQVELENISGKTVLLKIAGENAEIRVSAQRNVN